VNGLCLFLALFLDYPNIHTIIHLPRNYSYIIYRSGIIKHCDDDKHNGVQITTWSKDGCHGHRDSATMDAPSNVQSIYKYSQHSLKS